MPSANHSLPSEKGSISLEALFGLLGLQLPMLAMVFGIAAAQTELARKESLLRESARATMMLLERTEPTHDFETLAQQTFQSVFAAASATQSQGQESPKARLTCIPRGQCSYLSFSLPAQPEKWQPQLQVLFAAPSVTVQ
jgi:hypothetical protein